MRRRDFIALLGPQIDNAVFGQIFALSMEADMPHIGPAPGYWSA
jgi:hypothetical protein